jgi:hypothetical protein
MYMRPAAALQYIEVPSTRTPSPFPQSSKDVLESPCAEGAICYRYWKSSILLSNAPVSFFKFEVSVVLNLNFLAKLNWVSKSTYENVGTISESEP